MDNLMLTVAVYKTSCTQLAFCVTSMLTKAISNMHKVAHAVDQGMLFASDQNDHTLTRIS